MQRIDKGRFKQLRIERKEYEGHPYIDIRIFRKYPGKDDWFPTKKGVTLSLHQIEDFVEGLLKEAG